MTLDSTLRTKTTLSNGKGKKNIQDVFKKFCMAGLKEGFQAQPVWAGINARP